jgi:hypothetical protein
VADVVAAGDLAHRLALLVAPADRLTFLVPGTQASASIFVGPGFGTSCAEGGCPISNGSVNAISTNSLDLFQSSTGPFELGALMLILAVPNNPTNALTTNPVADAQLHVPGTNPSSTPVTVGSLSAETLMTHGDVEDTLGLLVGNIVLFSQLQSSDYFLFPAVYNPTTNPINNFSLYEIRLTTTTLFAGLDLINIDFTSLPVGTFALGYGTPSLTVTSTPFAQAGVSGVAAAAAVPEPTSFSLFGSALLCLVLYRRRVRSRRVLRGCPSQIAPPSLTFPALQGSVKERARVIKCQCLAVDPSRRQREMAQHGRGDVD